MPSLDPARFDNSVKPTDDFFQFVNGGWIAKNPIPPDEAWWGSFNTLRRDVDNELREILEEVAARQGLAPGSDEQKISDFYKSALNIEERNRAGIAPLTKIFARIDAIRNLEDLLRVTGELHRAIVYVWWHPFVEQDEKKSEIMALHLWQAILGMPDRDYYLKDDDKTKKIRADYIAYTEDMLTRTNLVKDTAAASAASVAVMQIETRLAKASLTRVELRDVEKMYHKMTFAEIAALVPQVPLAKYFEAANIPTPEYAIVGQPAFFTEMGRVLAETSLDDLKVYLRWRVLNAAAGYLSEDLERRNFDFYGKTLHGTAEMKPLWRRALNATNVALDELVGKLYVKKHFSEDAKRKIKDLVDHLAAAYRVRIERLDWMGEETTKKAIEKLGTVVRKLGYPDVWKDMSALTIGEGSFFENAMRAFAFEFDRKMKQVGGPVDRNEWLMSPQTVNAYYMPPMNEIVFPAAILQPPFFDPDADDAFNFGGIGSVIGHELTHGFDDQGSRFDARGNLNEWWTAEDKARFDGKAAQLAEQFDAYEPLSGVHINGKLTLGENIADLGGLLIAWDGFTLKMKEDGAMSQPLDGFTPEQRFFIGAAISECHHEREEYIRLQVQVDPHSPSKFRVNGPLSNMPEFYTAFGVKSGDKLYREPDDRVHIW